MLPQTRRAAIESGSPYYKTDKPCKQGHISKRHTKSRNCVACAKERGARFREHNNVQELYRVYNQSYAKGYRSSGANDACKRWRDKNPHKVLATTRHRQACKINATPPWYANEKAEIEELYATARKLTEETGVPHEVDHIVPLRGKNVCGLHCLSNLQILTKVDNLRKGISVSHL